MAVVYGLGLGGPKIDVKTTTGLFSRPDGVLAFHLVTDRLHFVRMKPEAFPDVFTGNLHKARFLLTAVQVGSLEIGQHLVLVRNRRGPDFTKEFFVLQLTHRACDTGKGILPNLGRHPGDEFISYFNFHII